VREYLPLARFFWTPTGHRDPSDRYLDLLQRGAPTCDEVPQLMRHLFLQQKSLINQMGVADLHLNFPSLITMNDRAAAAVGLENRTPFLDHRIVEFAFRMPSAYKIRDNTTKWILHEAARGLVPEEILNRKDKKGLVIPATHWLQNELKDWSDILLKRQARRGIAQRPAQISRGEFDRTRYGQVCLELWWELFVERSLTL
jgi:asparagine synthase (glutamine-hydrolysing)